MMPKYDVREVIASPNFRGSARIKAVSAAFSLAMLDQTNHSPHQVIAGFQEKLGNDVDVEVLWPSADCSMNSNNAGMVFLITCTGRSILFPADIQEPAERELLKHPERLRSDVLVAPHHGSRESSSAAFIAAVNPKVIVASNERKTDEEAASL